MPSASSPTSSRIRARACSSPRTGRRFCRKPQKLKESGLVDRLIVGDDADWGPGPIPLAPMPRRDGVATIADFIGMPAARFAAPRVAVDDVALLQYTGGTTGLPKGAMLTHANLTAAVSSYDAWYAGQDRPLLDDKRHRRPAAVPHLRADDDAAAPVRRRQRACCCAQRSTPKRCSPTSRSSARPPSRACRRCGSRSPTIPASSRRDLSSLRFCGSGGASLPVEVGAAVRAAHRPQARRRLGHDRDLARRHQPAARRAAASPARSACRCPASRWASSRSTTPRLELGPNQKGEIAIRAGTS